MADPPAAAQPRGAVTPARACAYAVVRRSFDEGAYADRAFRAEAERAGLDARERALAQRLAYGTIQSRTLLDYVIGTLSARPVDTIDPPILNALRLGVYQLVCLDSVPDHAAVAQTVELAKRDGGGGGHRFVNAIMRRAAREARGLTAELSDESPPEAAIRHSHPEWLVRMWWELLGPDETRALLERDNAAAESALRVNELRSSADEVSARLTAEGLDVSPAADLPEGLVVGGRFDAHASELYANGAIVPQSRASMLVARAAAPQPGERVLDLCAAPGAKTTHLAALMGNEGEVVAVERHPGRAAALARNCERVGASCVSVHEGDAAGSVGRGYDTVLLDPPCSDLGTLQSRPDVRWRKDADAPVRLAGEQARLLEAAAESVRPGGTLVYSTCTISPLENERQIEAFAAAHDEFEIEDLSERFPAYAAGQGFLQVLPHRHGSDGFFIARLRRRR